MEIGKKKMIIFDLDGTLTESKVSMDQEMTLIFSRLLNHWKVAVISGQGFPQFENQFLQHLNCPKELFQKLFLFPTNATRFYKHDSESWQEIYCEALSPDEKDKIFGSFEKAFVDVGYKHPEILYGEVIEDRGTQITFSALGQQAPLELKKKWKETEDRRAEIAATLRKYIPEFEVGVPGVTSIDVTRKGIDKGYGIEQIKKQFGYEISDLIFIGDALYEGGNDYPVKLLGVDCVPVAGPKETQALLVKWLEEMEKVRV